MDQAEAPPLDTIQMSQDSRRIPFDAPILVAHQPEFLPWLGFVSKAAMGDVYLLLDSVQFRKQYFQNRNKIRAKADPGWKWLIIPLVRDTIERDKHISDARISGTGWIEEHLRSIRLSYSQAPCFAEIFPSIEKIYAYNGDNLSDFNTLIIKYAFEMFGIRVPVLRTSELIRSGHKIEGYKTDLIISMCQAMGARTFVSGPFGKEYLDREQFKSKNINLVFQSFHHPTYRQVHGEFMSCMSFIDLLFNYGPGSAEILGQSEWESG
jgi:hypothetical protein